MRPALFLRATLLALAVLGPAGCGTFEPDADTWGMPEDRRGRAENARFSTIVDAYLTWHYATHPVRGTYDGFHDHDDRLPDLSSTGLAAQATALHRWFDRVRAVDASLLSEDADVDLQILERAIRASLLDLEEVRTWERDPGYYLESVSRGLYGLTALRFAPPERRMALAIERLSRVSEPLDAARANLKSPPAILTEMAIADAGGARAFIADSMPGAFVDVKDPEARKLFDKRRKEAGEALERFEKWLREDLAPRSTGSIALGEELFRKKLALEEFVEMPVDAQLAEGEALAETVRTRMTETARAISPDRSLREVLRETASDHPPADKLLEVVEASFESLKRASREKLYDVPADADCRVQETPAFRRGTSFASMELPGPFESVARDAFYSVTLPEPSWDAARREEHLRFFNRHALTLITVHEAYPGHYVQNLALRHLNSKIRRVFGTGAFSEGWAHYLEEAYVDEVEPDNAALRLHQLQMALLRICRYLVAIRMHCRGMTVDEAAGFFEAQGFQEPANARREARRGPADPMYLVYTLGKMQILHLREECRQAWGDAFSLKLFHHRLLATGAPPLKLARRLMLGRSR